MRKIIRFIAAASAAFIILQLFSCTPADTDTGTADTEPAVSGSDIVTEQTTDADTAEALTVTEEDGAAYVRSGDLSYKASGYSEISDGVFRFRNGFTAEFDGLTASFNRVTFGYSSSGPLKLRVRYTENSSEKTELFYLEAAEDGEFSFLILSYLNGGLASALLSAEAEGCSGSAVSFLITGVKTEETTPINKNTYYIENDRFKVGINLAWGGGINYISDKQKSIKGVTNLVNSHDTGRLIQQSYYGTAGNSEYQPGTFMNNRWVYNPVQGGDRCGNASRLIDLRFGENSVYIKAQPQDWSQDNYLTPSYMENTYTVTDEYIRVDNRFVDFSGWEHPYTGQELPALYTISYLSRFTWYDGSHPWQDKELSYEDDLNFWGEAQYVADCTKRIKTSNTETWCAWTNPNDDFGLGIYVPNVDLFKAGRYNFNNSKKATDDATNYVAPYNTLKMISYKPIEYSYLLTTGSVEQIRATFKENRDFSDNASLHNDYISSRIYGGDTEMKDAEFDSAENVLMLSVPNATEIAYSQEQNAAKLTAVGGDPHVTLDYSGVSYSADELKTLTIEYMIPAGNSVRSFCTDLFLCAGSTTAPDGNKRLRYDLIADGEYHTLTVDLSKPKYWTGKINQIRFDFFDACGEGDVMYLRSFKLS